MAVNNVTDASFDQDVLKSPLPILVDFYADWCGPCKMAEPVLVGLSDTYKDKAVIVKLNVDDNPQTAGKYGVMSIPTTILFKAGNEIGRQVGFGGKQAFDNLYSKGGDFLMQDNTQQTPVTDQTTVPTSTPVVPTDTTMAPATDSTVMAPAADVTITPAADNAAVVTETPAPVAEVATETPGPAAVEVPEVKVELPEVPATAPVAETPATPTV